MTDHDRQIDDLLARTQAAIRAERGWRARLRALPTPRRWALAVGALAAVPVAIVLVRPRSDLGVYPVALLATGIVALAGFAVYAASLLLRPLQKSPVGGRRALAAALSGLALTTVLALPRAHDLVHVHPESFLGVGDDFAARALGCFLFGLVAALPFVALLLALDRRDRRPRTDVALFAAAGGLAGNLALLLHCPLVEPAHLVAGHVPVTLGYLALLLVLATLRGKTAARV